MDTTFSDKVFYKLRDLALNKVTEDLDLNKITEATERYESANEKETKFQSVQNMVQLAYRLKVTPDDLIPDDVRPTENPEEITQDYIDSLSLSDYYKDSLKDLKDRGELGDTNVDLIHVRNVIVRNVLVRSFPVRNVLVRNVPVNKDSSCSYSFPRCLSFNLSVSYLSSI